jgi:hypothetical protein
VTGASWSSRAGRRRPARTTTAPGLRAWLDSVREVDHDLPERLAGGRPPGGRAAGLAGLPEPLDRGVPVGLVEQLITKPAEERVVQRQV